MSKTVKVELLFDTIGKKKGDVFEASERWALYAIKAGLAAKKSGARTIKTTKQTDTPETKED